MAELTQKEIDEAIEKRKKEIGELHPTVQNMLELLCASGIGLCNAMQECIEHPDEFNKNVSEEKRRDAILKLCGFFRSTVTCTKPLIDFDRGKTNMLAIMMAAKIEEACKEEKKDAGENS